MSSACLTENEVQALIGGAVAAARVEGIENHLDQCAKCQLLLSAGGLPVSFHERSFVREPEWPVHFEVGQLVSGRYRIVRFIARGGMGEVYEAFDVSLCARVALKTVRAAIAADAGAVERFKSEVLLARRVTHPNVCRIFDFGVHEAGGGSNGSLPFLTMELLNGATLASHVKAGQRFTVEQVLDVAEQLGSALLAAHRVNVIHKDLKAENVMLVKHGEHALRAVVTDFGLAATRAFAEPGDTSVTRFSGTPGYIAPERLRGVAANEACDVFSLGVVICDMLFGGLPGQR